jgi:2-(3-amino-3-carboxypropyl)histidine synthase
MVKTIFLEAPYLGKVELCKKTLDYLKENSVKTVALYAAVQFCNNLDDVKNQLNSLGIKIITSNPKRTSAESQVLGCDVYEDSLNLDQDVLEKIDTYLYIGDGKFHPLALLHGQKVEIVCDDPIGKSMEILKPELIEKIKGKLKGGLVKFHSKDNIGVIISTKPGQQFMKQSFKLQEKYPDKHFYYFVDDQISFDQLENFPFVDVWVNTACPRIGLDDIEKFRKGVVNLRDVI